MNECHLLINVMLYSYFDDPTADDRKLYVQYWQNKLKSNKDISFPDSLVQEVTDETDKFSCSLAFCTSNFDGGALYFWDCPVTISATICLVGLVKYILFKA